LREAVHGNLADASTLLQTVLYPMIAAVGLPPYRRLSSWPAAVPTATDGAAAGERLGLAAAPAATSAPHAASVVRCTLAAAARG